nr:YhcH/YjgK/YiaL family protein [Hydrotalea sp.]
MWMIIDYLNNMPNYNFQQHLLDAISFLKQPNLENLPNGKYAIKGNDIFALVSTYETVLPEVEWMESHLVYTDIHYIIDGKEQIGHGFLNQQPEQQLLDVANNCITYQTPPSFYSILEQGMFAIFFLLIYICRAFTYMKNLL